jgi:ATP-citrate lyase beta-subunit
MAQRAIREYDAKRMFAEFSSSVYPGYLIESEEDIHAFEKKEAHSLLNWVIKPDQLFGKRGKYGLIGVSLTIADIRKWWNEHDQKKTTIGKQEWFLTTFLIEPFVSHREEYYVAIKTERDHDVIYFSTAWGIEVEEHWESVAEMRIELWIMNEELWIGDQFGIQDEKIIVFITSLYSFFRQYGFAYLEVNPFTFASDGSVVCLDMVARLDDSEEFRQRSHWADLIFPHPFGPEKTEWEKYIEKLDSETGASLKFRILNPNGRIWLLTSGGGASVIIADTLADLGYTSEIGNYGECSGNPDRENTRAYTATLLDAMLNNPLCKEGTSWNEGGDFYQNQIPPPAGTSFTKGVSPKYLIIAGAIANFTHIDRTFAGVIDAFRDRISDMRSQDVHILVRRGGVNDTRWLAMMKQACEELDLPCEIADGSQYMTDILKNIKL